MKKLIFLGFIMPLLLWTNNNLQAQNVNIPDANFKTYLVGNAAINTNGDSEIQISEAAAFSGTINCPSRNIADLTGIEAFTALTYLNCNYNQLSSLDVSTNIALTYLDCSINPLGSLDVSTNTALTELICSSNQLSSLDVSTNTALTRLECYSNQLSSLDVSTNTALTQLYCYSNPLGSLDISTNTALIYLYCNNNQLNSLDVSNNTALIQLLCNNNQLSGLDVSTNTALTQLVCYYNQLSSLDVSTNTALTYLNCFSNQLSSLDLSTNTALTYFICSSNQLSSLDVSTNTALTELICSSNQLSSLDVSTNTALTYLNCTFNQLSSLNIKNGNNTNISNSDFNARYNPNLVCIQVDDVAYSTANWANKKDATASYRIFCGDGVYSWIYKDLNQNCQQNTLEFGLGNRILILNPGNQVIQTSANGGWVIDSLPIGTYTLTADTTASNWQLTCPVTQTFTITNPDTSNFAPSFGYVSTSPCALPEISVHTPFLRPGFSSQIYVQACNAYTASGILNNAYAIVELDGLLTVNSVSQTYTNLGNNQYRVNLGNLHPGQCVNFSLNTTLSTTAILGQTLCLRAQLYPVDSCALDMIEQPYPDGQVSPCTLPWDHSSLSVDVSCVNDSVRFVIYNTGVLGGGDMDCFAPVRVYLDGQFIILDSIQLQGGDSIVYMFAGNGQTWRLEADQHPLHPGNSHPNATMENCGTGTGTGTWTPNLVNILPQNDADAYIDIDCGLVTGSYDPNDKTGFPLGVGISKDIMPNQKLEYLIRFQNTGTDTAFTIVIRDTLAMDFNIFTVKSGVSSHPYSFNMHGSRVLEWTFNNIMLPDSNVNESLSHGFVKFEVAQNPDLPNGTVLENTAYIYFDYNAPIVTNTSIHTINDGIFLLTDNQKVYFEKELQILLYPNPTRGLLYLDKKDNAAVQIRIVDQLGRLQKSFHTQEQLSNIDMSNLPSGIYFISIDNGKKVATQKIVKQ